MSSPEADDLNASLSKSAKALRDLISRHNAEVESESGEGAGTIPVSTPDGFPAATSHTEVLPPSRQVGGGAGPGDPLPPITTDDPVLATMLKLVNGIKNGDKIMEMQEEVSQLISNQEARSELIANLALTHDYDRSVKYAIVRHKLEDNLLRLAASDNLSPTQQIMFLKIVQEEADNVQARVRAGANPVNDIVALMNRADFATQMEDAELQKKFANTTPQGREIVRRLAYKLAKATADKKIKGGSKSKT